MNVAKLISKAEQAKTLAYTIEGLIVEADIYEAWEECKKVVDMFYLLIEQIDSLATMADEISGHTEVCNAIYAVNRVEELKAEIERLKTAK